MTCTTDFFLCYNGLTRMSAWESRHVFFIGMVAYIVKYTFF